MKACHLIKIFSLLTAAMFFTVSAQALTVPETISIDGKDVKIETDTRHSQRVTSRRIRKGPKVHTVKAYATMYATFLASMLMTEKEYCDKRLLRFANSDYSETPTCQTEMYQMAKDPSMHVGIVAMTYTSLAYTSWANKKSRNILIRALGKKAKNPIKLLQTFNQSIGMGFGITAQTLINSTYNSPSIGKCFKEMRKAALAFDRTVEDAMETQICKDGYDNFVSMENGTVSEIHIAMMSLVVSTTFTAGVMTTIRGAALIIGHVLGKTNLLGWSVTGAMALTNFMIEFVDRHIEKYIRAYYHNSRSRSLLKDDFEKIIRDLNRFKEDKKLVRKSKHRVSCGRANMGRCENGPQYTDMVRFPLMDALKAYNYNINYRRRALMNTFVDSQSRWKQKTSGAHDAFNDYKSFLNTLLVLRGIRAEAGEQLEGTEFGYNPYFSVGKALEPSYEVSENAEYRGLKGLSSEQQIYLINLLEELRHGETFLEVAEQMKIQGFSDTAPAAFYKEIGKLLKELKNYNIDSLAMSLWRFKEYIDLPANENLFSMYLRSEEERSNLDELKTALEGVGSFSPLTTMAYYQFDAKGLSFEAEEKETVSQRGRKGAAVETEEIDVLKLYEDLGPGVRHSAFKLGNMLLHSVCNLNSNVIFDFNSGEISKVTFPHLIDFSVAGKVDCDQSEFHSRPQTAADFIFNPQSGEVQILRKNAVLHGVYKYNGKEYIGLLDLLTDPEVPLRWQTSEQIIDFWHQRFIPEYMALIGKAKTQYYDMLYTEFSLYDRDPSSGAITNQHIHTPLLQDEVDLRVNASGEKSRRNYRMKKFYYNNMSAGQTFLDQVRTSRYLLEQLGFKNERTEFLAELMADLDRMILLMDIPSYTRRAQDGFTDFTAEKLYEHPMIGIMGLERLGELGGLINKTVAKSAAVMKSIEAAPGYDPKKTNLAGITQVQAKLMIEKEVMKAVNEMINTGLVNEIFTDFLTAEGYVYTKE